MISLSATRKIDLVRLLLALVACTILVPRGSTAVLNPDDIIPLLAAGVGLILLLQSRRVPRLIAIPIMLIWLLVGLMSSIQNATSATVLLTSAAKSSLRAMNSILLFVALYKLTYRRPDRIAYTIRWIIRAATILGAMAVLLYVFSILLNQTLPGLDQIGRSSSVSRTGVPGRFVGTADAANFAAAFFLMTIPLTVTLLLASKKRSSRYWYLFSLSCQLFALIATFTRASMMILVLILVLLLIMLRRWRFVKIMAIVGLILGAVVLFVIPEYVLRFTEDQTGRYELWVAGARMIVDYPLFGVGAGNYAEVALTTPARYLRSTNPHNSFIMLGAEGGVIIMLMAILLAIISTVQTFLGFRITSHPTSRLIMAGLFAGLIGFWLQNLTNDLLVLPKNSTYFWLYYALALNIGIKHFVSAREVKQVAHPAASTALPAVRSQGS